MLFDKSFLHVLLARFPLLRRFLHLRLCWVHRLRYLLLPSSQRAIYIESAAKTASGSLFDNIEKAEDAGRMRDGLLVLHTGLKVLPTAYHGFQFLVRMQNTCGVDDLEEEFVFQRVLSQIGKGGLMIELGSFWAHYSLWFKSRVGGARNFCIEPELRNLLYGITNAEINDLDKGIVFLHNYISDRMDPSTHPATLTIDQLVTQHGIMQIDILHSDIQGAEAKMLLGARDIFLNRKVRYALISTHSDDLHRCCRSLLESYGYGTPVDIAPFGEFHPDGLLVAASTTGDLKFLSTVGSEMQPANAVAGTLAGC